MISVEFDDELEWWTQNILFAGIVDGMPATTARDQEVKSRAAQALGVGGLTMDSVAEDMRADLIEALIVGVDRAIWATEPRAGTEDGDRILAHLAELRATAVAARRSS